jgi:AmmeMemoRadiSam system protein A
MDGDPEPLTPEDRSALLRHARATLQSLLRGGVRPAPPSSPALQRPLGAFVSLHVRSDHDLRGCVGLIAADGPLVLVVERMAVAAATSDGRFDRVTQGELPDLVIEVSVLSQLRPIAPHDVEVGKHGLMVRARDRRGLLLPQVPLEHGWDRETFLGRTCEKAGLPSSEWREPETELLAFTAQVFGED